MKIIKDSMSFHIKTAALYAVLALVCYAAAGTQTLLLFTTVLMAPTWQGVAALAQPFVVLSFIVGVMVNCINWLSAGRPWHHKRYTMPLNRTVSVITIGPIFEEIGFRWFLLYALTGLFSLFDTIAHGRLTALLGQYFMPGFFVYSGNIFVDSVESYGPVLALAIIVSSLWFALVHYEADFWTKVTRILGTTMGGISYCFLAVHYGLLIAILAHAVHNLLSCMTFVVLNALGSLTKPKGNVK